MILPFIAADAVDFGDAWRVAELRPDHPILKRAQILWRITAPIGLTGVRRRFERIHENLAQPGRDRPHFRDNALGKLVARGLEPLVDELACKIDVGAILEHRSYLGESVA